MPIPVLKDIELQRIEITPVEGLKSEILAIWNPRA